MEATWGPLPQWAKCLPPDSMPAAAFLANCHALLCLNGGDKENWPRVGLEAMAAGVPIIAERAWGWKEMIEDGVTGLLCGDVGEFAGELAWMALHDEKRLTMAEAARTAVERLTDPATLGPQWRALFDALKQ